MRITSQIGRPTIAWDAQSGYANDLVPGSPAHRVFTQLCPVLGVPVSTRNDFFPRRAFPLVVVR